MLEGYTITWKLLARQQKWIFLVLIIAKRLVLQHWEDKFYHPSYPVDGRPGVICVLQTSCLLYIYVWTYMYVQL